MKERRGTVGRLAGLAENVAAAARRRQRERAPRVTLYDAGGTGRLLGPDSRAFDAIVGAAERMVELASDGRAGEDAAEEPSAPPSTGGVSVPSDSEEPDADAETRGGRA